MSFQQRHPCGIVLRVTPLQVSHHCSWGKQEEGHEKPGLYLRKNLPANQEVGWRPTPLENLPTWTINSLHSEPVF